MRWPVVMLVAGLLMLVGSLASLVHGVRLADEPCLGAPQSPTADSVVVCSPPLPSFLYGGFALLGAALVLLVVAAWSAFRAEGSSHAPRGR